MPEEQVETCAYRVVRYTPNLLRDEWFNIGIVLYDPARKRLQARLIESDGEYARLRRLHPGVDVHLVRGLEAELESQFAAVEGDPLDYVNRLDQNLSNTVQLSPQRAVLTADFAAEVDRLYQAYVEPPRYRPAAEDDIHSRGVIRARAREIFRRTGILGKMQRGVRVDQFTWPGDPLRMDFSYQRNGTRGFAQAVSLERDPAQAKVLAFTAERMRQKLEHAELTAITEMEPREDNERHRFVRELLATQGIDLVTLRGLDRWSRELGARLRPGSES